jgi:hypothetical protein
MLLILFVFPAVCLTSNRLASVVRAKLSLGWSLHSHVSLSAVVSTPVFSLLSLPGCFTPSITRLLSRIRHPSSISAVYLPYNCRNTKLLKWHKHLHVVTNSNCLKLTEFSIHWRIADGVGYLTIAEQQISKGLKTDIPCFTENRTSCVKVTL